MSRESLELDRRCNDHKLTGSEIMLIEAASDWRDHGCPAIGAYIDMLTVAIDLVADDNALRRQQISDDMADERALNRHRGELEVTQ